jgi:CheY-like chemotaxis protein
MKRQWKPGAKSQKKIRVGQPSPAGDHERDTPPLAQRRAILVVDDEPRVAAVLMEVLQWEGFDVELAANGEVALNKLRGRTFDVIMSDMRMPKVDGWALYRAVEQWQPLLLKRFIFLTGDACSPTTLEFLETTGVPLMTKPLPLEEIYQTVRRVLDANGRS